MAVNENNNINTATDSIINTDIDRRLPNDKSSNAEKSQTSQLAIEGMTCQACAMRIEKVLNKKPAIDSVSVNFATETLNVSFDADQTTIDEIVEWVGKTGFSASNVTAEERLAKQRADEERLGGNLDWPLILIWLCLLPFLIGMAGMLLGLGMAWMIPIWLQFILATVVQFGLALPYYKSAWASIRGGLANMDVLVVLGTVTIWLYSTYIWISSSLIDGVVDWSSLLQTHGAHASNMAPVYFEAGVMIIAFVRLGKYLEHRTKKHSLNSINLLLELTPQSVEKRHIISPSQAELNNPVVLMNNENETNKTTDVFIDTSISEILVDDELRARQGSRIATDGVVIEGEAWCDESHLTGESEPVKKDIGDIVMAGAMVTNGSVVYRVTAKGRDTQLSDMVQALSEAQGSKAELARLADKVAGVFVPAVVTLALLTLVITWWLTGDSGRAIMHAVSVLVIACPCALGLATPAAIMAGMGVAAKNGIWFKDAPSLEQAGSIDIVVFDKTGTLTVGRPQIASAMMMHSSIKEDEVLQLAASVEVHTSHPIASAIVQVAEDRGLSTLKSHGVDTVVGAGVQAQVDGYGLVKVGTADFVGLTLPKRLPKVWSMASTVAVSVDDVPLGIFALMDDVKADSKATVNALIAQGKRVVLLSGDKRSAVDYIADKVGIAHVKAEMSPRAKADYIAQMQAKGYKVAMVGDGVNDAPAMATADASFAMGAGTDVAQHSASARLIGESLTHVDTGLDIANATVSNIKQNLFFAFVYNCLGIPLAAFGLLNPMIAAAAMALSSISVLMNALRLTRYKGSSRQSAKH